MACYTEPSSRAVRPLTRDTDSTKEQHSKTTTPEQVKSTTEVSKNASESKATASQVAKKKSIEPAAEIDEPPTKRVTRAQLKECNIVLEKISDDVSVKSLTKVETTKKVVGKGKRQSTEALAKKFGHKKPKRDDEMKNINPEYHSLRKYVSCLLCDKPTGLSIVNHYVNFHPSSEVVCSRLSPDVADSLRNSKVVNVAQRQQVGGKTYTVYVHPCYFCNVTKGFSKLFWINHIAKHTGYYQYKCNDCWRLFAEKNNNHKCKDKNNLVKVSQPQFHVDTLKGYICDLCNFVRFHQNEIENHLRCEHELTVTDKFKEVVFLNFPKRHRKGQFEDEDEEEEELENDEQRKDLHKRQKLVAKSEIDDNESSEKVLRSRVVHTEAFISEPKEDDGLFDKDTMKLMKDMSFSASKDGECTSRPNRAKSIAEKLSERFNSVQEDSTCKPDEIKETKSEPLDPLRCDDGITIIRVTAGEDFPAEESNAETAQLAEISTGKFISSSFICKLDFHNSIHEPVIT